MKMLARIAVPLVLVLAAIACAAEAVDLSSAAPGTTATTPARLTSDPNASIALVQTSGGLAGVPVGSHEPVWVRPGAVAAPDGSAIFAADNDGTTTITTSFWRLDPRTGAETSVGKWVVPGGQAVTVAAVEPGGASVALASFHDDRTIIFRFDPTTGGPATRAEFEGHLEPEAFSVDGRRVFAARRYSDHYRVTTLDLATQIQYPTGSYDKAAAPEDMYGYVIQSVLTPDHTQLATLYRDPHSTDHPAFVHLLDLRSGFTVCIDLPAPFATGSAGTDALRANPDGTIDAGHHSAGTTAGLTATIDPNAIFSQTPQRHYHVEPHPDPDPPATPDAVSGVDGFTRFIAIGQPAPPTG